MINDTDMQRMTPLASIIDQLQNIARQELPTPRSCVVKLWDDGDYLIRIYHSHVDDKAQAIEYDVETGDVLWKYRKGGEWVVDEEKNSEDVQGTPWIQEFEESETRTITTIEPPVER